MYKGGKKKKRGLKGEQELGKVGEQE